MPSYTSNRWASRNAASRQPVRLLTAHEKPQRCNWPSCAKPATGTDAQKVYCPTHFYTVVSKQW